MRPRALADQDMIFEMSNAQGTPSLSARPVISVIMPAFNAAPYIATAVASALGQSLSDLEVIAVDDGSCDDTFKILERIAVKDPRLRVLKREVNSNRPAVARNDGLRLARAAFIAFLDSDDVWRRDKIARQLAVLRHHPQLLAVHSFLWPFRRYKYSAFPGLLYLPSPREMQVSQGTLSSRNVVQCSSVIVRRSTLEDLGGFDESPELRAYEDYELWLRISRLGNFGAIPEVHGFYRKAGQGILSKEQRALRIAAVERSSGIAIAPRASRLTRFGQRLTQLPLGLGRTLLEGQTNQYLHLQPRVLI